MDKIDKNGTAIFFFIVILIGIIFGGYYILNNKKNNSDNKEFINNNEKKIVNKIDKDKDFLYFINEDIVSEEDELVFKDIKFNFESNDAKKIENKLNDEMNKYRKTVEKNDNVIEKMNSIDYEYILSSRYISLIVNEYTFTSDEEKDSDNVSYYVFDLYNGKLLDNKDIMKNENIKEDDILKKIKEYIENDDNVNKGKTLDNEYYLTIGKNGKVIINFIVNSDNINYNVSMEMSR